MSDTQIALTADEKTCLVRILEGAFKNAQIEEHRTRAPAYREIVLKNEALITSILKKLADAPA
jgi:hypothetical protein